MTRICTSSSRSSSIRGGAGNKALKGAFLGLYTDITASSSEKKKIYEKNSFGKKKVDLLTGKPIVTRHQQFVAPDEIIRKKLCNVRSSEALSDAEYDKFCSALPTGEEVYVRDNTGGPSFSKDMEGVYDAVMQNFRSFMLAEDGDLDDIHDFMKEKEGDSEGGASQPGSPDDGIEMGGRSELSLSNQSSRWRRGRREDDRFAGRPQRHGSRSKHLQRQERFRHRQRPIGIRRGGCSEYHRRRVDDDFSSSTGRRYDFGDGSETPDILNDTLDGPKKNKRRGVQESAAQQVEGYLQVVVKTTTVS